MKIAFYANHPYYGGLAPNGGSRTILLCCKTLRKIGHVANVVTVSDKFKWFSHPAPWKKVPHDTDVVIAVSISDVKQIWKMDCKLAYYARPFETWQISEDKCLKIMRSFELKGGKILVNSLWQYEYLFGRGVHPYLVHAGIDFNKWEDAKLRPVKKTPTILCQYSDKKRKNYKEFKRLKSIAPEFNYISFGKTKKVFWPEIVGVYNEADYFFVPNKLEGFYNCAAEAALCGCTLVVRDGERHGCSDFVTAENSIVYREIGEAVDRIRRGCRGNVEDVQDRLIKRVGTRFKCMQNLVKVVS